MSKTVFVVLSCIVLLVNYCSSQSLTCSGSILGGIDASQALTLVQPIVTPILTGVVNGLLTNAGGSNNTCSTYLTSSTCPSRNGVGRVRLAKDVDINNINNLILNNQLATPACRSAVQALTCNSLILDCPTGGVKIGVNLGFFATVNCTVTNVPSIPCANVCKNFVSNATQACNIIQDPAFTTALNTFSDICNALVPLYSTQITGLCSGASATSISLIVLLGLFFYMF